VAVCCGPGRAAVRLPVSKSKGRQGMERTSHQKQVHSYVSRPSQSDRVALLGGVRNQFAAIEADAVRRVGNWGSS